MTVRPADIDDVVKPVQLIAHEPHGRQPSAGVDALIKICLGDGQFWVNGGLQGGEVSAAFGFYVARHHADIAGIWVPTDMDR
jgi:hypothetical protein